MEKPRTKKFIDEQFILIEKVLKNHAMWIEWFDRRLLEKGNEIISEFHKGAEEVNNRINQRIDTVEKAMCTHIEQAGKNHVYGTAPGMVVIPEIKLKNELGKIQANLDKTFPDKTPGAINFIHDDWLLRSIDFQSFFIGAFLAAAIIFTILGVTK